MFAKKEKVYIGIDVGTSFIKAVAVDRSKPKPQLVSIVHQPFSEGKSNLIKKAISDLGFSSISIATSISGPSTIIRLVEMPQMTEKELKGAARFEAEKYIPYELDEVVTDSIKVENLPNGKMSVLLVAAKKSTVENRIKLFANAGLSLQAIDIDAFAIMNAFLRSEAEKDKDSVCTLVNFGAKSTNINIIKGSMSYLVRDVQMGGNDITSAIADRLSVRKDEAENLKKNPEKRKGDIEPITKSVLFNLLNELRFSFDFYENHYGKSIQKVYISGGSCKLEAISPLLKDVFSGEVLLWDPFKGLDINEKVNKSDLKSLNHSFAIAVGLALRGS